MPNIAGIRERVFKLRYGITTPYEFFLAAVNSALRAVTGKEFRLSENHEEQRKARAFFKDGYYQIGEFKFPLMDKYNEQGLRYGIYWDTFGPYLYFDDKYDEKVVDLCISVSPEGPYGLVNDKVNVTVEPGDIVIDAGTWIGDFAAYSAMRGATAYAFEPTQETYNYLLQTIELNKNFPGKIIPVNKGLSDKNAQLEIFISETGSEGNTLLEKHDPIFNKSRSIEVVRLDDFVKQNNLSRVDFIKADIEGSERDMLAGAQETLKNFAPKLALCTYHLKDDPEVLEALIKQANPAYNVVQKSKKLYASVPK